MKKGKFLAVLSLAAVLGTSGVVLTGCNDPKPPIKLDYNMTGVSLADVSVAYDGTPKTVNVAGVLPEGVTATYKYYKINDDETLTELIDEYPVNVGKYKIVTTFNGDYEKYNVILDLSATLTITKTDVNVVIGSNKIKTAGGEEALPEVKQFEQHSANDLYLEYDGREYIVDVVNSNVSASNYNVSYFTGLNPDGTVDASTQTLNNTIKNVGDTLYVLVTTQNSNLNANIVKKVSMERKTIEISDYAGLVAMVNDCNTKDKIERVNYRYVLTSDIDGQDAVWSNPGQEFSDPSAFCSEFNGNGHTISNLQITNASVKNLAATHGLHVGFFGYTVDADIHDVTFENIDINITTDGYTFSATGTNPVYAGIVVARMECDGSNGGTTDLENITVKNCNIYVNAYKAYVGAVIGMDHARSETVKRNNLVVEDATVYATPHTKDKAFIGGIVGRTQGGNVIVYNNCVVKNIKLGYDQIRWNETYNSTNLSVNKYLPNLVATYLVGAFVGQCDGTSITFNNSHVQGSWRMTGNGRNNMHGYYGKSADNLHINDCTHTDIPDSENMEEGFWWGAMHGVATWDPNFEPTTDAE